MRAPEGDSDILIYPWSEGSKTMKKRMMFVAVVAILITICASGTMAFFTAEERTDNKITSGMIDVQLVEEADQDIPMMPNTKVEKTATIKNLDEEAFVRASCNILVFDKNGKQVTLTAKETAAMISLTMNDKDWAQKADDTVWWYYQKPVETGAATAPLFTEIVFDGAAITDAYQGCTAKVMVDVQAVQTANNGTDAMKALGWPEK